MIPNGYDLVTYGSGTTIVHLIQYKVGFDGINNQFFLDAYFNFFQTTNPGGYSISFTVYYTIITS
jgi:hypothetical protein